jgi:predicted MFS family arabinose efflux permease
LLSTAQLGGLAIASWGSPRVVQPRRRVLVGASLLGSVACLFGAVAASFPLLLVAVFADGLSLGAIAWIAWAQVFGDDEKVADIAVITPLVGTVAAPIIGVVLDLSGTRMMFAMLAVLNLIPIAFVHRSSPLATPDRGTGARRPPTRAAVVLLACLFLMGLGGSCLGTFAGVVGGTTNGMSALAVSIGFSLNALAGIPSARWRGSRRWAGGWVAFTGVGVLGIGMVHEGWMFWVGMAIWGFGYWMGVPAVFKILASMSAYPGERAGDAQAVMSAARVVGPLVGGAVFTHSAEALSAVAGGCILAAAVVVGAVERRGIRPTDPTAAGGSVSAPRTGGAPG